MKKISIHTRAQGHCQLLFPLFLLLAMLPTYSYAGCEGSTTIYVDLNASGLNNGTSWTNAYTDLQEAIDCAEVGDEIWVAEGTYALNTESPVTCYLTPFRIRDGITLYGSLVSGASTTNGRDFSNNATIFTGQGVADILISLSKNTPSNPLTVLDGFQFKDAGQAILSTTANYEIRNAVFSGFSSDRGVVQNFRSTANFVRSRFADNTIRYTGGVLFAQRSQVTVDACYFESNSSNGYKNVAGCILYSDSSQVTFLNSVFYDNSATRTEGIAPFLAKSELEVINCTFHDNTLDWQQTPNAFDSVWVYNTIVRDYNTLKHLEEATTYFEINYSIVPAAYAGTNLWDTDPQFTSAVLGDLSLTAISPAINTGNNMYNNTSADVVQHQRITNTTIDVGAYEYCNPCVSAKQPALAVTTVEKANEVRVFPSPTDGPIQISSNSLVIQDLTVFDAFGRIVLQQQPQQQIHTVDLANQASGIYYLLIHTADNQRNLQKIVVY